MNDHSDAKSEKRARIVLAAAQVFARRGFAGTLISDIAAEAGIGKGTIYEYFASKEGLFFAVFEWFVHRTAEAARVRISALGESAPRRLMALVESVLEAGTEMMDLFSLSMEFWAASSSSQMRDRFIDVFREMYQEFRQILSALIQDGIDRGEFRSDIDPGAVAAGLVGGFDGLLLQAWFDRSFDPIAVSRAFMAGLIKGLANQKDTPRNPNDGEERE